MGDLEIYDITYSLLTLVIAIILNFWGSFKDGLRQVAYGGAIVCLMSALPHQGCTR